MSPKKITFEKLHLHLLYIHIENCFLGVSCEILVLMNVHWCWWKNWCCCQTSVENLKAVVK